MLYIIYVTVTQAVQHPLTLRIHESRAFFRKFIIHPSSIIFHHPHHRCVNVRKEELVKSAGVTAYLSLLAEVTGDIFVCFWGKVNYDPQGDVNIPAIEVV